MPMLGIVIAGVVLGWLVIVTWRFWLFLLQLLLAAGAIWVIWQWHTGI